MGHNWSGLEEEIDLARPFELRFVCMGTAIVAGACSSKAWAIDLTFADIGAALWSLRLNDATRPGNWIGSCRVQVNPNLANSNLT